MGDERFPDSPPEPELREDWEAGKATVVKAGADWEILALNDLEEHSTVSPYRER